MSQKERILVTGGSGFVGQALIKKLVSDKTKIIVATVHSQNTEDLISSDNLIWKEINLLDGDLKDLFLEIDVVYHLAGYSGLGSGVDEITKLTLLNEKLTQRLLEHGSNAELKHFIYISSISACEKSTEEYVNEENGLPQSTYGLSKKKTEEIVMSFSSQNLPITILRPTALFGKNHKGSIYELTKRIKDKRFFIIGTGDNFTNFYYIEEFIDVLLLTYLNKNTFGKIYIASSDPLTLNCLVKSVCDTLQIPFPLYKLPLFTGNLAAYFFDFLSLLTSKELPFSRRRMEAMTGSKVYSNKKLRMDGLTKKSATEKGLKETVEWFLDKEML